MGQELGGRIPEHQAWGINASKRKLTFFTIIRLLSLRIGVKKQKSAIIQSIQSDQ